MSERKTRPILFSGPMVSAILGGRKTQTRRVLKVQPRPLKGAGPFYRPYPVLSPHKWVCLLGDYQHAFVTTDCAPGDLLWVKEAWNAFALSQDLEVSWPTATIPKTDPRCDNEGRHHVVIDYATEGLPGTDAGKGPWRASIHMPRWASRLTLRVTDVRVERVQDITEADATAEGCAGCLGPNPCFPDEWDPSPDEAFRDLWERLNAPRGFGWEANPWVAAITFEPFAGNIGAPADWTPIVDQHRKENPS